MSTEQESFIFCPRCGNRNALNDDECGNCQLSLVTIRNGISSEMTPSEIETYEKVNNIIPPLPKLKNFPQDIEIGEFILQNSAIFPNFGGRKEEVCARFITSLSERTKNISYGVINQQSFFFVYFPLNEQEAHTIVAVRIEPQGKDLFVEWRRYVKTKNNFGVGAVIWIVILAIITYGLTLFLLLSKSYRNFLYKLGSGKTQESQLLESTKHELIVRTRLREACKSSGIPSDLVNSI